MINFCVENRYLGEVDRGSQESQGVCFGVRLAYHGKGKGHFRPLLPRYHHGVSHLAALCTLPRMFIAMLWLKIASARLPTYDI